MTTSVPARDLDVAGRGVRQGRRAGRPATIGGNDAASAPRRRIVVSRSSATSRSVRPTSPRSRTSSSAASASAAAARMRVELGRVLDQAQRLDRPAGGDELDVLAHERAQPAVLADRELGVVEAEPQRPVGGQLRDDPVEQVGVDLARPAPVELLGRLREVAEVGDEPAHAVGPDERRRRWSP